MTVRVSGQSVLREAPGPRVTGRARGAAALAVIAGCDAVIRLLVTGSPWPATLAAGDGCPDPVLPALVLLGAGTASSVPPPTVLATSGPRGDEAGAAAGVRNSPQSVGGSIGLAVLVTVSSHSGGTAGGFATGSAFAGCARPAALFPRHRRA